MKKNQKKKKQRGLGGGGLGKKKECEAVYNILFGLGGYPRQGLWLGSTHSCFPLLASIPSSIPFPFY